MRERSADNCVGRGSALAPGQHGPVTVFGRYKPKARLLIGHRPSRRTVRGQNVEQEVPAERALPAALVPQETKPEP